MYKAVLFKALTYIEHHLNDSPTVEQVANHVGYSPYHFERLFKMFLGDSIKSYIRLRQMSHAVWAIYETDKAIVDIGMNYAYASREAFSRALKKHYGLTPSFFRTIQPYYLRDKMDYDGFEFEYNKRLNGMKPRWVSLKSRQLSGYSFILKKKNSRKEIPLLWQHWRHDKSPNISLCVQLNDEEMIYFIGFEGKDETLESFILEETQYAVFDLKGPIVESIHKAWDYIYHTWLPQSGYQHRGTPDMECYVYKEKLLTASLYVPIDCNL